MALHHLLTLSQVKALKGGKPVGSDELSISTLAALWMWQWLKLHSAAFGLLAAVKRNIFFLHFHWNEMHPKLESLHAAHDIVIEGCCKRKKKMQDITLWQTWSNAKGKLQHRQLYHIGYTWKLWHVAKSLVMTTRKHATMTDEWQCSTCTGTSWYYLYKHKSMCEHWAYNWLSSYSCKHLIESWPAAKAQWLWSSASELAVPIIWYKENGKILVYLTLVHIWELQVVKINL